MTHIHIKGTAHPVSSKFMEEVGTPHPDLLTSPYEALVAERDELLRLSEARHTYKVPMPQEEMAPGGTLTVSEHHRLDCLTHAINVHHGVNFLQGRHHGEFGFEGVDQVHGNAIHLQCGCILHHVFDHHMRNEETVILHPHHPRKLCRRHKHEDFKVAHAAALADNQ